MLNEKLKTELHRNNNIPNKQTEILNKCQHKNSDVLISYYTKD